MACACIRGEEGFNFNVKSLSCKVLSYQDMSEWMETLDHKKPGDYTIQITTPSSTSVNINVTTSGVNKITSKELYGTPDVCIKDGIYCVKLDLCGIIYTKYFAYTCNLECKFSKYLSKIKNEDVEIALKIKTFLDATHASANQGEMFTARDNYNKLKKLIDAINC